MKTSTERFTGKAGVYAAYRPGYPEALVDWLYERVPCEAVCDVGAGTGIFTRCLGRKPWVITAVEPNGDMRAVFREELPGVRVVEGCGEATGLGGGSFGLVTIAQAFHWVDEEGFREECKRILVPGGKVAIVWNNRVEGGIAAERDAICREYCPEFRMGHVGKRTVEEGDVFLREEYLRGVEVWVGRHAQEFTEAGFVGEALSRSYALGEGDAGYVDFVRALREGFRRCAVGGIVREDYEAMAYLGGI